MKKILKKAGKLAVMIIASVLALVILVLGILNVAKFAIYSDYYSMKSDVCKNPGLNDGFVCQGICAFEDEGKIFVSGYMADGSASRIYITDLEDNSYFVTLKSGGNDFCGHAGGIAVSGERVYIADENKLYLTTAKELLSAQNGQKIDIGEGIEINNKASFVFADEKHVYVGEFHDGNKYVTDHPYDTPDGEYHAVMSRYSHDDLTKPEKVFSIRNKVQGMCLTDDGRIILSTSYGVADSVYYVYNEEDAKDSGLTLDGAPLFYLTECVKEFKGPAMSEGLDFSDGKVITLTESASNKYIFGKFFFANKIVALDI